MFSGDKTRLRPLYEAILDVAIGLGADVRVCPARDRVQFYRGLLFAQVAPTARAHLDLGLALGTTRTPPRLVATHAKKRDDRLTHRIALRRSEEIDAEVRRWLGIAYELAR